MSSPSHTVSGRLSSGSSSGNSPEHPKNTETSGTGSCQNPDPTEAQSEASGSIMLSEKPMKKSGKRPGRKPSRIDGKAKLERSRQSARECRARKKLRYQYLEELVRNRERAIFALRDELEMFKQWCIQVDEGNVSQKVLEIVHEDTSRGIKGMTGQRSRSSSLGTGRTSTVTSGAQGHHQLLTSHKARSFDDYELSRSSDPFARSFDPASSDVARFHSVSSPLHGSGALLRESAQGYTGAMSAASQVPPQGSQISMGHYSAPQFGRDMPFPSQGHQSGDTISYNPPITQAFIDLANIPASHPVTSSSEDPVTTLAAITSHSSFPPSYETATSSMSGPSQPSTSQGPNMGHISWLSLLDMMDGDTGLSRQGAESASGTPQSTDGRRILPTVVPDFVDSDSSS